MITGKRIANFHFGLKMEKDEENNRIRVLPSDSETGKTMETIIRPVKYNGKYTLVEGEIITGRTHQIRAHMAFIGHPLIGDGKYGVNKDDRAKGYKFQALYSYKLTFQFSTEAGGLEYLNGKSFQVDRVDFVDEYFPGIII